jgi:hypothetical protein
MAERVLGHIIWLLEEAQEADSASQRGEESREIKRVRSGDLTEKKN